MTYATDLKPLGPVDTTVRKAQATLDELWAQTDVETRAYTGNMIALTVKRHLGRVQEALAGLEGRYAGRQIIGVMDGTDDLTVHAALVPQSGGLYVERLTLEASPEQLQGAILPLIRPATVNHVWWGADSRPEGTLLAELTEIADQVIVDSLTLDVPPSRHYALADLGWSRSAGWREALAQLFDSPDAARQLGRVTHLTVRHAGRIVDPFAPDPAKPDSCGGQTSLWTAQALAKMPYRRGAVLNAGFADAQVTMGQVEDGAVRPPGAGAPLLVAYVRAIALIPGDEVELDLKGPDGRSLARHRGEPLQRWRAQDFVLVGKRRPPAGWAHGVYAADYRVWRGGKVALSRRIEVRL